MATATSGLRERKNQRTRTAITRAALELALEVGFERATIAQIAERADVSPRTVHQWFPSKEDIIVGASREPRERLAAELADGEGDVLDRLRRWVEAEGDHRTEPDDLARRRHRVLLADPHLRALQRARLQDLEEIIAAAIAKDTSLPADAVAPRALAAAIATTLLALQQRFVDEVDPEGTRFEATDQMLRAALTALRDRN
jgi:AcrR family transcriptional regulator